MHGTKPNFRPAPTTLIFLRLWMPDPCHSLTRNTRITLSQLLGFFPNTSKNYEHYCSKASLVFFQIPWRNISRSIYYYYVSFVKNHIRKTFTQTTNNNSESTYEKKNNNLSVNKILKFDVFIYIGTANATSFNNMIEINSTVTFLSCLLISRFRIRSFGEARELMRCWRRAKGIRLWLSNRELKYLRRKVPVGIWLTKHTPRHYRATANLLTGKSMAVTHGLEHHLETTGNLKVLYSIPASTMVPVVVNYEIQCTLIVHSLKD